MDRNHITLIGANGRIGGYINEILQNDPKYDLLVLPSLRNLNSLEIKNLLPKKSSVIINAAGTTPNSIGASKKNFTLGNKILVTKILHALELKLHKFIHISTTNISTDQLMSYSDYVDSKLKSELEILNFTIKKNTSARIIRIPSIWDSVGKFESKLFGSIVEALKINRNLNYIEMENPKNIVKIMCSVCFKKNIIDMLSVQDGVQEIIEIESNLWIGTVKDLIENLRKALKMENITNSEIDHLVRILINLNPLV